MEFWKCNKTWKWLIKNYCHEDNISLPFRINLALLQTFVRCILKYINKILNSTQQHWFIIKNYHLHQNILCFSNPSKVAHEFGSIQHSKHKPQTQFHWKKNSRPITRAQTARNFTRFTTDSFSNLNALIARVNEARWTRFNRLNKSVYKVESEEVHGPWWHEQHISLLHSPSI